MENEKDNNTISKKLCAAEVLKTLKFYKYFVYAGFIVSFVLPMVTMLSKSMGYIFLAISALMFMFGIWINKKTTDTLLGRYNL